MFLLIIILIVIIIVVANGNNNKSQNLNNKNDFHNTKSNYGNSYPGITIEEAKKAPYAFEIEGTSLIWFTACEQFYTGDTLYLPYGITEFYGLGLREESRIKKVVVPDTVAEIGHLAFGNCKYIEEVVLPDNLTSIDRCAFLGCERLSKINIPSKLQFVGDEAFANTNIKSLDFNENVELGKDIFVTIEPIYNNFKKTTIKRKTNSSKKTKDSVKEENKNMSAINCEDYYYVVFKNHRNEEEDCFMAKNNQYSKNEIQKQLEKDIRDGYEWNIEHGGMGFSYDDKKGLRSALWAIHNDFKMITRDVDPIESKEFKDLKALKSKMERIDVYIDASNYYEEEDGDPIDSSDYSNLQELLDEYGEIDLKLYSKDKKILFDSYYYFDTEEEVEKYLNKKISKVYFSENYNRLTVYLK